MKERHPAKSGWAVALPTLVPVIVAYVGMLLVLVVPASLQRATLVVLCGVLLADAMWLTRALFGRVTGLPPFLAALATVLGVWLWQWRAFVVFFPDGELRYGYFRQPNAAEAHLWVLQAPFWVGTILLGLSCIAAIMWAWRRGLRLKALCAVPWWLGLLFVFSLPSAYFDAQGNASVFI